MLIETLTFSSLSGQAKRISDRVMAIDMAERGADFVEVFRHFVEKGTSEHDAYKITQRVFRGGMVAGRLLYQAISYVKGYGRPSTSSAAPCWRESPRSCPCCSSAR